MARYCGREISEREINQIKSLIEENPKSSRRRLSEEVCKMLKWFKPDGGLKSCRVAILRMDKDGFIPLPPTTNMKGCFERKKVFTSLTEEGESIGIPVNRLSKLELVLTNRKTSKLWNEYIDRYHYLGYTPLPGAQLRYFVGTKAQMMLLHLCVENSISHLALDKIKKSSF